MSNDGKFLNLSSGIVSQELAINTSAGAGDANKIIKLDSTGKIDTTMMPTGVGPETRTFTASETLSAGDLVNIWNSTGPKVRKADNTAAGKEANGFVLAGITSGASGTVYPEESVISGLTSITPGVRYFLGAAGAFTATPPSSTGAVVQEIGVGISTTEILFRPRQGIVLA